MLKTLDKAKRKRLELQEEGKPIQRRAEWQGYAYDMVCAVQMGGPALRIIAWNLEGIHTSSLHLLMQCNGQRQSLCLFLADDIPQLARKFMSDNGFGDDQNYYVQLVSLLAKNSVLFASEEIERLASNQNDEIEQTEGMKSPRNPPPHSIAVHPPICKHVPKRVMNPQSAVSQMRCLMIMVFSEEIPLCIIKANWMAYTRSFLNSIRRLHRIRCRSFSLPFPPLSNALCPFFQKRASVGHFIC